MKKMKKDLEKQLEFYDLHLAHLASNKNDKSDWIEFYNSKANKPTWKELWFKKNNFFNGI